MIDKSENIVGYFPVVHRSYLEIIDNHPYATIGVLGADVLRRFDYLRKDIRALEPTTVERILKGLGRQAFLVSEGNLLATMNSPNLIMPDDDVSRTLSAEFNSFPQLEPVFLRWDRSNVATNLNVEPDRVLELEDNDPIIAVLRQEAAQSSNWWRAVAAAVVEDGNVISLEHNSSVPTEYSSAIDGDPRITSYRGESIEISIDIHAESRLIARHAKEGAPTLGQSIYVTTFPCANCAKLIVEAGFVSCYFIDGYASLDGQSILKAGGVELVKIKVPNYNGEDSNRLRAYPSSRP